MCAPGGVRPDRSEIDSVLFFVVFVCFKKSFICGTLRFLFSFTLFLWKKGKRRLQFSNLSRNDGMASEAHGHWWLAFEAVVKVDGWAVSGSFQGAVSAERIVD
jgi:hypothetical protein